MLSLTFDMSALHTVSVWLDYRVVLRLLSPHQPLCSECICQYQPSTKHRCIEHAVLHQGFLKCLHERFDAMVICRCRLLCLSNPKKRKIGSSRTHPQYLQPQISSSPEVIKIFYTCPLNGYTEITAANYSTSISNISSKQGAREAPSNISTRQKSLLAHYNTRWNILDNKVQNKVAHRVHIWAWLSSAILLDNSRRYTHCNTVLREVCYHYWASANLASSSYCDIAQDTDSSSQQDPMPYKKKATNDECCRLNRVCDPALRRGTLVQM